MTNRRTESVDRTFDQNEDERRKVRPARASSMLQRAMISAETCVTRAAFRLGMSEAYMRKLRAGDAQLDLRDLVGLAEHEPVLFDALLDSLASLRGKVVVEAATASTVDDQIAHVATVAKETGEAVSASLVALSSRNPSDRRKAIVESKEAIVALSAQVKRLERDEEQHVAAVTHGCARGQA